MVSSHAQWHPVLAGLDLFAGLPAAARDEAIHHARIHTIPRRAHFFNQGDPVECAHVLLSGAVRITQSGSDGGETVVRFIGPGEPFGSIPIFTDHCYPADGIAMLESTEASWRNDDLLGLISQYPRIAVNLIAIVGRRLGDLQNRVREMATQRVDRRIANALLRLAQQAGHSTATGIEIAFPLRCKDIADISGTTLHTVSRTINDWRRRGLIGGDRHGLTLTSSKGIVDIADG